MITVDRHYTRHFDEINLSRLKVQRRKIQLTRFKIIKKMRKGNLFNRPHLQNLAKYINSADFCVCCVCGQKTCDFSLTITLLFCYGHVPLSATLTPAITADPAAAESADYCSICSAPSCDEAAPSISIFPQIWKLPPRRIVLYDKKHWRNTGPWYFNSDSIRESTTFITDENYIVKH